MRGSQIAIHVLGVVALASVAHAGEDGRMQLTVSSLRNDKGTVRCALFRSADGFPKDVGKAVAQRDSSISGGTATLEFTAIAAGTYAVSCVHDEDGNGTLTTNLLGIPKEGLGASNDAKRGFGPPTYDEAKFDFDGSVKSITVHVGY
jgi:uncharacterized protein (DUF2141 family)